MNLKNLCDSFADLVQHMENNGFSQNYVKKLRTEVKWLARNCDAEGIQSYEDACRIREHSTESVSMQRWYRLAYGVLKRFDCYHEYPDRMRKEPLVKRGAYPQLTCVFREVVNSYIKTASENGLKKQTIRTNAGCCSCFLLSMQKTGHMELGSITEDDVMSFFTAGGDTAVLSSNYKNSVATVLRGYSGIYAEQARRIVSYLPPIRPRRKNIQYLTSEEAEAIHKALDGGEGISLRDRAIGMLLFFTGIRGCDIARMKFSDIDWEQGEISLIQQKTGVRLTLPLMAPVGNAIYDYILEERPESNDAHIFLRVPEPHTGIGANAVRQAAAKIYRAASVRQEHGSRQGTHLFRHHLATALSGNDIARPVISGILGHGDPASLDSYLAADMEHLKKCALSIEDFPVKEEVFML